MGKTRDLFKKIKDTKGTFHAKMGTIKDEGQYRTRILPRSSIYLSSLRNDNAQELALELVDH